MDKEELDLLEIVFILALGACAYNDINNIRKLEDKIKTINNLCKKQKEVISRAIEYITSYESISTIQGLSYIEDNRQFDEKTMTEMINRYLLVHDKLLQILEDKEVSE